MGQTIWNGWQAVIRLPSTYRITQIWNVFATQIGNVIVVTGSDRVPPGGAVGFGFATAGSGPAGPISVTCTGL